ncbi:MAG TPA: threonine synthase [Candidatus Cryosericum sp.]|nr:threonine synthase [Candidatus Cryosericum sp.]
MRAVRGRRGTLAGATTGSADAPLSRLRCIACSREAPLHGVQQACEACGDLLDVVHDLGRLRAARPPRAWRRLFDDRLGARDGPERSGVWRYRELVLPDLPVEDIVSKPEGNTNLYRSPALEAASRTQEVRIKHEGENPTLSFKDRGMTTGVSFARHLGVAVVACASTGDTSAALAAYAAEVPGLRCLVLLPRDKVSPEQLSQPLASGALTVSLPTDFDGCLRILREVCRTRPIYLLNSINPVRLEGQKSIGYEIVQDLGWEPPDWIVVPVGNAGNISAIGKGLFEMREIGLIDRLPRLLGVQAEAAAPLARACREGYRERVLVEAGATVASAIRIGDPASYDRAVREVRRARGAFASATEQEILDAKALVDASGVYICPNSATAVAGFLKARAGGLIGPHERVVIVATAHGCKFSRTTIDYHTGRIEGVDPARANRIVEIEADARAVERLLGPEEDR